MKQPLKLGILCIFFFIFGGILLTGAENTKKIPVDVGVVVDYEFEKWVGQMWLSCINMSLSDLYVKYPHYKTRLFLHTRDSKQNVLGAASAALDLLKNVEVPAILGPTTSMQVIFLTELGEKAEVPIVSFSASTPLSSIKSPYFFQATQNDKTQAEAIGAVIQNFGWRAAVPIYIDNEYGVGFIPYLMESLQKLDIQIPHKTAISPSVTDSEILNELYKLMTMPARVFVLHVSPSFGSRLVRKAKEVGMLKVGYVWILTDGMANFMNSMDPFVMDSMQGVLGVKPYVPNTLELESFRFQWKRKFNQDHSDLVDAELNVYGLWAYDATKALAIAIEKATSNKSLVFQSSELVRALANTSFKGLSGDFCFVDGQLKPSVFQIVNLHGERPTGIGFWTPGKGLSRELNSSSSTSSNKVSLGTIIWPGDSTTTPKGWDFRTNEKKMKIGVPSATFEEFVNATVDPITNAWTVNGFCIEVFDAVMKELSYARDDYEYIPFANPNGSDQPAGNTDDLVSQVSKGNFDVVVGDITIVAYRLVSVDFTLPYIQSEVSMLVRIKDEKSNDAMAFFMPLTPSLWATTFCFFLFVAFVIWVLEHRINDDFRGSPSYQAGTSLWFAFSIMVFAHRERVINNLARVVIIVWSFVLLILTHCYTASFSSLLTVEQLHPAVTDVQELIKKQEYVGYFNNSLVFGILKNLGFKESYLIAYESPEHCDQLLSLGSKTGGIAAAFDESPYMKIILARNCSNYTLVSPSTFMSKTPHPNVHQFKTGGFGFVFPKGSPLVSDVSRAILKVTQNIGMQRIEDTWINDENRCSDKHNSISSTVLGLGSFWGLFLIAGAVSFSALLIYIAMFVYAQRDILITSSEGTEASSTLSRIFRLLKVFYQKDPKADALIKENNIVNRERVVDVITRQQVATTFEEHTVVVDPNNEQTSDQETIPLHVELITSHVNQDGAETSENQDLHDQKTCDQLDIEITCHVNEIR